MRNVKALQHRRTRIARMLTNAGGASTEIGECALPVSQTVQRTQERHPGENSKKPLSRTAKIGGSAGNPSLSLKEPNRTELSLNQ